MFVSTLNFSDHFKLLAVQSGGLAMVIVLVAIISAAFFAGLRAMGMLRVDAADESDGLDLADHGVQSYPESQRDTQ